MPLKQDLKKAFEDNLKNGGKIEDISKLITEAYKKSVEENSDTLLNSITGVDFDSIEKAIIQQFKLSETTRSYLQFTLIEAALIKAWTPATLVLPAVPPPPMVFVISNKVSSSSAPGVKPLVKPSDGYDDIVNAFFNVFSKHASSIVDNYIGINSNGVVLLLPVVGFTIK